MYVKDGTYVEGRWVTRVVSTDSPEDARWALDTLLWWADRAVTVRRNGWFVKIYCCDPSNVMEDIDKDFFVDSAVLELLRERFRRRKSVLRF